MNLGDTFITIFVMLLISCIFFIFPLMITANQTDSAARITLQTNTQSFINEICDTGKITRENYDKFIETITGPNTYNIEIEVKILDENPNKKITEATKGLQIGENNFLTYYTSQIVQQLDDKGVVLLKEGDQVHISITNTNVTLSQQLALSENNEIATIMAEETQTCTMTGI